MSWDNVAGVSLAHIWTDNPDMTQAYLFANGNHQVKVTVGLSFKLGDATQPGPTEDEIKTALTLINYETGAGLSHLKTADKGNYGYVYQPNMPAAINVLSISNTSNPGAYQYEWDYYLSSDSTINANYASEKVALLLSYIDVNGNKIDYATGSGTKYQSFVTVTVYPPKKYGVAGSASTPVIIKVKDDKLSQTTVEHNVFNLEDQVVSSWSLKIDDSYFRMINFDSESGTLSNLPFYRHGENVAPAGAGMREQWKTNEGFVPVQNKLNQESYSYDTTLSITYKDGDLFIDITVNVQQGVNELIFIDYSAVITPSYDSGFSNLTNTVSLSPYDQFGNKFTVEVSKTNDGFEVTNVT